MQLADDIPAAARKRIDVLRTDTEAFQKYLASRTYRHEDFWVHPTGRIGLCNVSPPVRINDP